MNWYYNRAFGFKHDADYDVEDIPEAYTKEQQEAAVARINEAEKNARSKDDNGKDIEYHLDYFIPDLIQVKQLMNRQLL